jgi:SulP family sulfate permease
LAEVGLYDVQNLLVPAIAMMLIAYANTITTARTFARKDKKPVNSEQEFLGLGASNIGSGLFGGLPVSASSVRTAINYQSKPSTQFAQIFGAIAIGLTLLFFGGVIKYLPVAVLAVVIILAVIPLFNYKELKSIWHAWRSEAILAIITAIGVAMLGIYQGLLLAVLLAIANVFRKSAFPYDAVLGVAKDGSVHDMHRPPKTHEIPGLKIYRFDAPLYFANANHFRRRVLLLIDESDEPVKWFLWDAETVTHLDSTSGQMLLELIKELKQRNITFAVARMKGTIRNIVHHSHRLSHVIQKSPHYNSIGNAIQAYREEYKLEPEYKIEDKK